MSRMEESFGGLRAPKSGPVFQHDLPDLALTKESS